MIGEIWNAIQPEVVILALALAGGGASYLYQWALQRLPAQMRTHMQDLAQTAVTAIEQKYKGGNPGSEIKKQEAMELLLDLCQDLKLPINLTHASAAIEAAVFALNAFTQPQTPSPLTPTLEATTLPMPAMNSTSKNGKPLAAG